MSYDVHPARPQSLTPKEPTMKTDTGLMQYAPYQWRVINALYMHERVIGGGATGYRVPGALTDNGKASVRNLDLRRLIDRQGCAFERVVDLETEGLIIAYVGQGDGTIPLLLAGMGGKLPTGRGHRARVVVELTAKGHDQARDPFNMVLRTLGRRPNRYTVADVTRAAGIPGPDVKPVLTAMEGIELIEARNDQGALELAMWKRSEIPPHLRLRLTRKGGTYLARR